MTTPEPRRPLTSIELLFDPATEAAVRAEWDALAALGMSSLAAHVSPSNRPHVTLLVRDELPLFDAPSILAHTTFPVTLSGPVLFGTGERRVLARSIVPTTELLGIHSAVHQAAGPGLDAPHTEPGAWSPHVTLARRLRTADLAAALNVIGPELRGHVTGLRRWDSATATVTDIRTGP